MRIICRTAWRIKACLQIEEVEFGRIAYQADTRGAGVVADRYEIFRSRVADASPALLDIRRVVPVLARCAVRLIIGFAHARPVAGIGIGALVERA